MKLIWKLYPAKFFGVIGYEDDGGARHPIPAAQFGRHKTWDNIRIPNHIRCPQRPPETDVVLMTEFDLLESGLVTRVSPEIRDFLHRVDSNGDFSFSEVSHRYEGAPPYFLETAWIVEQGLHHRGIEDMHTGRVLRHDDIESIIVPADVISEARELGFKRGFRWNGGDFGAGLCGYYVSGDRKAGQPVD